MAIRQLCKQVSFALVFATAVLVGVSTPAGAVGAGICGGDLNVSVETHLVAGESVTVPVPTLEPGHYTIRVKTIDSYEGRENDTEATEQVSVSVDGLGSVGVTPDLADLVGITYEITSLGVHELAAAPASVTFTHVGGEGPNGVTVRCIGFKATTVYDLSAAVDYDCDLGKARIHVDNQGPDAPAQVVINGLVSWQNVPSGVVSTYSRPVPPGEISFALVVFGDVLFEHVEAFECPDPPGDDPPGDDPPGDDPPGDDPPGDDPPGDDPPGDDPPGDDPPGDDPPGDDPPGGDPPGDDPPGDDPPGGDPVVLTPVVPALAASLEVNLVCQTNSIRASVAAVGGDQSETATVALVRSADTTPLVLTPDTTTTVSLPLPVASEGETVGVVLVTESGDVISRDIAVDCLLPASPEIDVVVDCASRTLAVVVTNAGEESTLVSAFAEQRALLGTDELGGGDVARFEIDLSGPTVPVRVVGDDGADLLREEVEHGCQETDVAASAALVCPAGEIELVLANSGTEPRTVEVGFAGTSQNVVLGAGENVTLVRAFDVGSEVELQVTSSLGDVVLDEVVQAWACDRDATGDASPTDPCTGPSSLVEWTVVTDPDEPCAGLSVRLVVDCTNGEALASFTNESPEPVDVVIEVDSRVVDTRTVGAWSTLDWTVVDMHGSRVAARLADESAAVLDAQTDCARDPDRTLAVLSGLIIGLMSIVTGVVARFDPWLRV